VCGCVGFVFAAGVSAETPAAETPTVKRKRKAATSGSTPTPAKKQATPASKSKSKPQSATKAVRCLGAVPSPHRNFKSFFLVVAAPRLKSLTQILVTPKLM
jgi:hypothetical protein